MSVERLVIAKRKECWKVTAILNSIWCILTNSAANEVSQQTMTLIITTQEYAHYNIRWKIRLSIGVVSSRTTIVFSLCKCLYCKTLQPKHQTETRIRGQIIFCFHADTPCCCSGNEVEWRAHVRRVLCASELWLRDKVSRRIRQIRADYSLRSIQQVCIRFRACSSRAVEDQVLASNSTSGVTPLYHHRWPPSQWLFITGLLSYTKYCIPMLSSPSRHVTGCMLCAAWLCHRNNQTMIM